MSEFREIFVKAVCGRDRHVCRDTNQIRSDHAIDEVLGCRVTKHRYAGMVSETHGVKVNGSYEVHLWYTYGDGQNTGILSRTVDYSRLIPYADLGVDPDEVQNAEASVTVTHGPIATETDTVDTRTVRVSVEIGYLIELVGDTRLCVKHFPGACEDEWKKSPDFEDFSDDDLEEDFEDFGEDEEDDEEFEQTA